MRGLAPKCKTGYGTWVHGTAFPLTNNGTHVRLSVHTGTAHRLIFTRLREGLVAVGHASWHTLAEGLRAWA